ncbi:MAG: helix-turn-helix transcriptional regulator [Chloroflexi bacterium]|uniref:Helix-turn-helix transcriptional regulator n=1 Tax=Candidatus Chlorohelix allophototropha TaxID=3003348 RepID=A0A8T7M4E5_9CHLR|nr:helix-turn-helix transcriptional regulator [Chloroflexota bacterium]WJW70034.1 metalloregulator ArsR/SmtB family transcription factor [Chloroflexota bacterium L227-S17]
MSEYNHKEIAQLFKILSNPGRVAILEALRDDEHCVCHIENRLKYRQAYISQQLILLREAGLVEDRRDGWNIYYRVTSSEVFGLIDTARTALKLPTDFKRKVTASDNCPCPKCNQLLTNVSG